MRFDILKKDFFKDSKIKFPAYEPWISGDDKKIINKTLSQSMLTLGPQLENLKQIFVNILNQNMQLPYQIVLQHYIFL